MLPAATPTPNKVISFKIALAWWIPRLLPMITEPNDPATVSEVSRMLITFVFAELPVAFMCVYKPKRPETSKPFLVGAFTVKPKTLGNRPTEIDEISDPPSP